MTQSQKKKCHAIIHTASAASGVAASGLAQIPLSDNAVIVPIQTAMIISLGGVFGVKLTQATALSTLATASATIVGRGISQVLVGWIPGIGNVINASTAASLTETIGWIVAESFDEE